MRPVLSAWDRHAAGTPTRPGARGPRPVSAVASLAVAAGLLALSVLVAAFAPQHGLAADTRPPPTHPKPGTPVATGGLYRIVGCASFGVSAHRGGPARREVAIGFDDGPWTNTGAFVRMLERNGATATFFMIGRQISAADRTLLLRELRDGDVLGDHTYSHPDLTRTGDVRGQLLETLERIRAVSGYTPCLFRPPYGAYDTSVVRVARSLGLSTVLWNVDPADWSNPGTPAIEQRVLSQVRPGSIIISHDGGGPRGQTLAAYPGIIRGLRARGYRIVSLPQLLGYRPIYEPCIRLCAGIGVTRKQLPRDAIIRPAP